MAAWQRGQFVAPGSDGNGIARESHALGIYRLCSGFRRGPLDHPGGFGRGGSGGSSHGFSVHALPLEARTHLRRENVVGDAPEEAVRTSAGTASSKAAWMVQRPSP